MTRNTTVTAVFAGDTRSGGEDREVHGVRQGEGLLAISKHYKTGKIGSTKYHYFRKSKNPLFTTTMTAYKGRYQRLEPRGVQRGQVVRRRLAVLQARREGRRR